MPPWSPASSEGSTGMVPYSRRIRGSVSRRDLRVINLDLQNNPKIRGLLLTIRGSWILRPKEQLTKGLTPFDLGDILGVIARRLATVTRNLILRRSRYCNEKNTSLERMERVRRPLFCVLRCAGGGGTLRYAGFASQALALLCNSSTQGCRFSGIDLLTV